MRALLPLVVTLFCIGPAMAAQSGWICQVPGDSVCRRIAMTPTVSGIGEVDPQSIIAPFIPIDGDLNPEHYALDTQSRLYYKGVRVPDKTRAKIDIVSDPALGAIIGNLLQITSIVDDYSESPALAQAGWAVAKQSFPWLTPNLASVIEKHGNDNGLIMVAPLPTQPQVAPSTDGGSALGNI